MPLVRRCLGRPLRPGRRLRVANTAGVEVAPLRLELEPRFAFDRSTAFVLLASRLLIQRICSVSLCDE